jgi:hypothetical protein
MICCMKISNGWSTYNVSSGVYYWIMLKSKYWKIKLYIQTRFLSVSDQLNISDQEQKLQCMESEGILCRESYTRVS